MRSNTAERWIQDRVDRYGPVSKLSLLGTPTVLVTGPAANKFVFFSSALAMRQPLSVRRILGERNLLELGGADHKRIRGALAEFLKPDMLRLYVGKIDGEVRRHIDERWEGRSTVTVMPLMKRLTFDIITSLLFGLERGPVRDALAGDFERVIEGVWSVPVDLPFTAFRRSLRASAKARRLLVEITRETKAKLERGEATRSSNLIACLLSLADDRGVPLLSEEEIVDSSIVALIGGHDTSSILMAFMIRHLASDAQTLAGMVQGKYQTHQIKKHHYFKQKLFSALSMLISLRGAEHDEVAKGKGDGEALLTWEDLGKMKFTWRVAQETLRVVPPVFDNFRTAIQDVEFGGYTIPKGWQVFWTAGVTHMDAAIFPEPHKFDPSRFENNQSSSAPPCSFVAFGGGPRICVGMEFARIETLVTMHHLLRRFRWRLCCKEDTFARDPMPTPLHGLPIEIEHRTYY
ncbi:hypothetical protein PR202_gb21003 [Eleusine coracana subsp. coracana]|uniref:Uncharacterized protein n=1 Tax=Eleusine coracana subsp. coracana TaxID=191504 RepID=A0AAV5FA10_ELECO|nr:hypothetical protein PR202_gb21003 [Eleusine coracana subsp. coracana]